MKTLPSEDLDRIIEMAWEDRTPFEAIEFQFGLSEPQVIAVMRQQMKASSFKLWRKGVSGRKTKHAATSRSDRFRASCHKGMEPDWVQRRTPRSILSTRPTGLMPRGKFWGALRYLVPEIRPAAICPITPA